MPDLLQHFFQLAYGLSIDGIPPCECNCLTCDICKQYVFLFKEVDYRYRYHNSSEGHLYDDSPEVSRRRNHDRLLKILEHYPEILLLFEEHYFKIQPKQALFKQAYNFPKKGTVIKTDWKAEITVVRQGLVFFEADGIMVACGSAACEAAAVEPSDKSACEAAAVEPSEDPPCEAAAVVPSDAQ